MKQVNVDTYTSYDYKKLSLHTSTDMQYLDGIKMFGWLIDEQKTTTSDDGTIKYVLRRNRNIMNRTELIRLEKNFDFCFYEILRLQSSISSKATMWALSIGIIGTCFMAGSTFAVTHKPPIIWLCVILAIPGFVGWILPYFVFKAFKIKQTIRVEQYIKENYDEIERICNKASALMNDF